jgi:patched 1 protein
MAMSLEHTLAPVVHGAISTFMGIIMLAGAEFDFIIK